MAVQTIELGQHMTIGIMAFALGMDAFSLGIGIGMKGIRLLDILKISFLVGLFHMLMPLIGMHMGHYFSDLLGNVATLAGGTLLALLGLHMIYSALQHEPARSFSPSTLLGLLVISLSVSLDAFSVGITLGLFATDLWLTILSFGAFGMLMAMVGLLLGRKVSFLTGGYGEALGGVILLVFGVRFLV